MSYDDIKAEDWIMPSKPGNGTAFLWENTKRPYRVTKITKVGREGDGRFVYWFDLVFTMTSGPLERGEIRLATYEERERGIAIECAERTLLEARENLRLAEKHIRELTTTACPTCGHRG